MGVAADGAGWAGVHAPARRRRVAHDLLTVTPNLDPITALCEHEQYQRLADGSPVHVVLAGFDEELLEQRGIPPEVVDPLGALVLPPGTLAALGVAEGDLVGVRLSTRGSWSSGSTAPSRRSVGARLAATLDADEPVYFDAAVWTACVEDPAMFTEPLPPLCEIVDDYGLAHSDEWLAPRGFDFARWRFERECEALAERYDIDSDDAFALHTLVDAVRPDVAAVGRRRSARTSRWPMRSPQPVGATRPRSTSSSIGAEFGAELADPLLAELLLAETVGTGRAGAAALGLFAEVMEPRCRARRGWRFGGCAR